MWNIGDLFIHKNNKGYILKYNGPNKVCTVYKVIGPRCSLKEGAPFRSYRKDLWTKYKKLTKSNKPTWF